MKPDLCKCDVLDVMPRVNRILEPKFNFEDRVIQDYETLRQVCAVLRAMGKRIVLTKGVYDLLHVGHLRYIAKAKEQGDILVMSVDTDALARKRKGSKGKNRPVVEQDERIEMLLHSRYVDIVTFRDVVHEGKEDDTDAVRPHVLVKSRTTEDDPDGINEMLKEKYGLEIVVLDPQAQTSTTARIRKVAIDGAEELSKLVNQAIDGFLSKMKGD